jgi:hypothetical protein
MSVASLQQLLQGITISTIDSHDYEALTNYMRRDNWYSEKSKTREKLLDHGLMSHSKCGEIVDLAGCANRAVAAMKSPTLDSHRRHMEEQAKK